MSFSRTFQFSNRQPIFKSSINLSQQTNAQNQRQTIPQEQYNPQQSTIKKPTRDMGGISSSKIKWRDIMKIDLDMIVKTSNYSILEHYLHNILYSDVTEEDIQSVPEGNIVKLIKVFQYTVDHLLTTQQSFESKCKEYERQFNELTINNYDNDQNMLSNKDEIKNLKKANKENEKLIMTYKTVISCLQTEKRKETISQRSIDGGEAKKQFFCQYCTGKKFFTKEELGNHLLKRHLIDSKGSYGEEMTDLMSSMKRSEEDMNRLFDRKVNDLKSYFEDYLNRMKYEESRNDLERRRKDEENKQEKSLMDMENKFKEALNDMKEFALQMNVKKSTVPEVIRWSTVVVKSDEKEREREGNAKIMRSVVVQKEMKGGEDIEQEKEEKEVMDRDKIERERKEAEELKRNQLEKEQLEKEQQQRKQQEREQKDREQQEKMLQETKLQKEKEQKEKEQQEKVLLEKEQTEKEPVEREQKQKEKLEREQLEREQLEREQLEREQVDREQQEREQVIKEQVIKEQQEREQQEKERIEKEELEREEQAREQLIKEQLEREEQAREQLIKEQLEKEQQEQYERKILLQAQLEKEQQDKDKQLIEQLFEKERLEKEQQQNLPIKEKTQDNKEDKEDQYDDNFEIDIELEQEVNSAIKQDIPKEKLKDTKDEPHIMDLI